MRDLTVVPQREIPRSAAAQQLAFPAWLRVAFAIAIVVGIFFRFYHIDHKVYWGDEIVTSLRVLGLTEGEVVARSPDIRNASDLRSVLHPGPEGRRPIRATLHSLVVEDPHHAPLYYLIAHAWVGNFGDSIASFRMLSAILGVLALPCMYWLCAELFASKAAAWMGTALYAIAPVSVLYSQEAREYALWSIAILLMSATFLRATRLMSPSSWGAYCAAVTFGLYVYPFSAFLALGNLAVLGVGGVFPTLRDRLYPIAASAAALVLFAPWVAVMVRGRDQIDKSMHVVVAQKHSAAFVLHAFLTAFPKNFIDLNLFNKAAINLAILIPVLVLIAYSIVMTLRAGDGRMKVFILAMMVSATAPFLIPDLLSGGNRTTNPRYFTPLYIALDLSLVYLFTTKISALSLRSSRRPLWPALLAALLVARAGSDAVSSQSHTWWNKFNEQLIEVAQAVNTSHKPILLTDNYIEYPLSLSNYLSADVALELRPHCYQCAVANIGSPDLEAAKKPGGDANIFLLGPSARLRDDVQAAMQLAGTEHNYHCIDVRSNCDSPLHLW